jgi:hypothetical protein
LLIVKAKQLHGENPDLKYFVTYVLKPDHLPKRFKVPEDQQR